MPITRRTALKAAAAPLVLPARVLGLDGPPPSETVRVGTIAAGNRARQLIDAMPPEGRVVAVSDCDARKLRETQGIYGRDWPQFTDWRAMIDDASLQLDAVLIASPDHGRSLQMISACAAGLDVYAEKPLTVCVTEGRAMVDAARRHGRVVQVGTQQRTIPLNRWCCEAVQGGRIGEVGVVHARRYDGPWPMEELPGEEPPEDLDWDEWCGPTELRPYNPRLIFDWMKWRAYSGGLMTNWGAHGVDMIQFALGKSLTGPREVWPLSPGLNGAAAMRYEGGPEVRFDLEKGPLGGAVFTGSKAKLEINRNRLATNPAGFLADAPPPTETTAETGRDWTGPHLSDWLDCIKTRGRPNADVEIGHRSVTACHLVNIARRLGRKLTWDAEAERFEGDAEADALLDRPRRAGYELPG